MYILFLVVLIVFGLSLKFTEYPYRHHVMKLCGCFFTLSFQPIMLNSAMTMKNSDESSDWERNSLGFAYLFTVRNPRPNYYRFSTYSS